MQEDKCHSCGARVIWIRTAATGALMPLDATPTENGNVVIVDGLAVVRGNMPLLEPMLPGGPRYQSHFVSCPSAARHRKPKEN